VADAAEAAALTGELIEAGDVVLVKASRGVGLEAVAEALVAADASAAQPEGSRRG
jgi:UDP-N-acetylmuramyl pentapeptide synthase